MAGGGEHISNRCVYVVRGNWESLVAEGRGWHVETLLAGWGMEGWQRAILARSIDPGGLSTCLCCGEDGLGPGVEGVVNMGWVW